MGATVSSAGVFRCGRRGSPPSLRVSHQPTVPLNCPLTVIVQVNDELQLDRGGVHVGVSLLVHRLGDGFERLVGGDEHLPRACVLAEEI